MDVNYGGSTGYGREYRDRLRGTWGEVDVEDSAAAARYLVERGDVDGTRVQIFGGSAGGYTTLLAMAVRDEFTVGVSYYGVADLVSFHSETHKFESHYDDYLVGPWPEAMDAYRSVLFEDCVRAYYGRAPASLRRGVARPRPLPLHLLSPVSSVQYRPSVEPP